MFSRAHGFKVQRLTHRGLRLYGSVALRRWGVDAARVRMHSDNSGCQAAFPPLAPTPSGTLFLDPGSGRADRGPELPEYVESTAANRPAVFPPLPCHYAGGRAHDGRPVTSLKQILDSLHLQPGSRWIGDISGDEQDGET